MLHTLFMELLDTVTSLVFRHIRTIHGFLQIRLKKI